MVYTVKGHRNRHFELFNEVMESLGKLDYTSWFGVSAEILLPDGEVCHIGKASLWKGTLQMTRNEIILCTFKCNSKSNMEITMANGQILLMKRAGMFKSGYKLLDNEENILLILNKNFRFANFSFNYSVELSKQHTILSDSTLVLFAVYAAKYHEQVYTSM